MRQRPVAAGRGIEPRKPASKTGGLPLTEPATNGVTGENRTLVEGSTAPRLSHSATVTLGVRGTNRTYLSGFSDRRLDHNGLPDEFGGDGENRTLIGWVQTSSPPVERHPRNTSWRLTRCTPRDLLPRSRRNAAMNLVAAAGVEPANDLPYESDLVPTSPQ